MTPTEHTATAEQIAASTNINQLIAWYDHAEDMAYNVSATIEAREAADISDDEWFFRASDKYAFCRVAMRRITRRLYRLGFDGRLVPGDDWGVDYE